MDPIALAKYPFTQEAMNLVRDRQYSLEDVVIKPAYGQVRTRARKRVLNAIGGEARPDEALSDPERELLSYPVTRMMIATLGDQYLVKRFAVWESKRAYELLLNETDEGLIAVGSDFSLSTQVKDRDFILHFTDYLKYASGLRSGEWKLINRKVIKGKVFLPKDSYARLLEEAVREKVQAGLNVKVPPTLATALEPYLKDIRDALDKLKSERGEIDVGEVSKEAFPPCMRQLLADLQSGINLPHTARFALTSFLANIGLDKDAIMELYRMAPDFREDLTRYQVEHILGGSGTEYTSPSCKTMMTYGNCGARNKMCDYVSHPLVYYRKVSRLRAKEQAAAAALAPVAEAGKKAGEGDTSPAPPTP